jgi:hypothetical protein
MIFEAAAGYRLRPSWLESPAACLFQWPHCPALFYVSLRYQFSVLTPVSRAQDSVVLQSFARSSKLIHEEWSTRMAEHFEFADCLEPIYR